MKKIYSDLKGLKPIEYIFLVVSGLFLIMIGLYDFSGGGWVWAVKGLWKGIIGTTVGVIAWTGIVNVFLVGKGKISNYFWGMINASLYGIFAITVGYTGDAMLGLFFYVPAQVVGYVLWKKSLDNTKTVAGEDVVVKARKITWKAIVFYIIMTTGLSTGFYYLIPVVDVWLNHDLLGGASTTYSYIHNQAAHILDAVSNSLAMVAMTMMLRRYTIQWYVWIIMDIIYVVMFSGINGKPPEPTIIIMYGVYIINAIYGSYLWAKVEAPDSKIIKYIDKTILKLRFKKVEE